MNFVKAFISNRYASLTAWLLLVCVCSAAGIAARNPWIVDGLLWRFERLESQPRLGQRIFENNVHFQSLWDDRLVPLGSTIIFGDSHLRMLPRGNNIHTYNFAIGGQAIRRMVGRVKQFKSLSNAKLIVVNGGENDLTERVAVDRIIDDWYELLNSLPKDKKIMCVGLPVTDGPRINAEYVKQLNAGIARVCQSRNAIFFDVTVGVGLFQNVEISQDHMHLSVAGQKILMDAIDRESNRQGN